MALLTSLAFLFIFIPGKGADATQVLGCPPQVPLPLRTNWSVVLVVAGSSVPCS